MTSSQDIRKLTVNNKEIILIGTAHISNVSANLVKDTIESENPDCVCLELDEKRYKSMVNSKKWENLNLKEIIKKRQLSTLLVNVVLSAYQNKLAKKMGVKPGTEFLTASKTCKELNIPIELCDRDIRITLRRTWHSLTFIEKLKLIFSDTGQKIEGEMSEEMLAELRKTDVISKMINDVGKSIPSLIRVLIDERDDYLAENIRNAPGDKIIAVVGAGHMNGIVNILTTGKKINREKIEKIPKASPVLKIIGWGIPTIIIGSIAFIGYSQGITKAWDNILIWIFANGLPSMLGAVVALAHPATIISAFLGAPLTSLSPVIGAGYVTAFVQFYFMPPVVKNFTTIGEDVYKLRMWWSNRLLQIFLVFILTGLGSALGTYLGAYNIFSNLSAG